jgi:hypothetical protein
VRKSNLATVDQLAKEAQKAAAEVDKANHDAEGGRKAEAGKGSGKGAGGHSGQGH